MRPAIIPLAVALASSGCSGPPMIVIGTATVSTRAETVTTRQGGDTAETKHKGPDTERSWSTSTRAVPPPPAPEPEPQK